jgi:hypothetical protein
MRWPNLMLQGVLPILTGDAQLLAALGGSHIYTAQSVRPVRVPSVEWIIVGDFSEEVFNPLTLQLDFWAVGPAQAAVIEGRLRALLHRETRRLIGGISTTVRLDEAMTLQHPSPGVVARSLRFNMDPVRQIYPATA